MSELVAIRGPLEIVDGDVLRIELSDKLVKQLEWKEGDVVSADNHSGLLNIEVWDGTE
ncbi:MAG TPA: hypothetical protein VG387_05995 [Rhizomicrobium sp.]|nr:hypothetical protein [Rhizomicrobium sp.]